MMYTLKVAGLLCMGLCANAESFKTKHGFFYRTKKGDDVEYHSMFKEAKVEKAEIKVSQLRSGNKTTQKTSLVLTTSPIGSKAVNKYSIPLGNKFLGDGKKVRKPEFYESAYHNQLGAVENGGTDVEFIDMAGIYHSFYFPGETDFTFDEAERWSNFIWDAHQKQDANRRQVEILDPTAKRMEDQAKELRRLREKAEKNMLTENTPNHPEFVLKTAGGEYVTGYWKLINQMNAERTCRYYALAMFEEEAELYKFGGKTKHAFSLKHLQQLDSFDDYINTKKSKKMYVTLENDEVLKLQFDDNEQRDSFRTYLEKGLERQAAHARKTMRVRGNFNPAFAAMAEKFVQEMNLGLTDI